MSLFVGIKIRFVAAALTLFAGPTFLQAERLVTIRSNGDPANRVDLVVLGDGYTLSEMDKYAEDVEKFIQGFFTQEPGKEYSTFFNVHRIDVISRESGADHPSRGIYKDTALDAAYEAGGIARLLVVNTAKVDQILNDSAAPNQRDIIIVVVNDPEYGGSGGRIAVASVHPSVVELVLHETGHSFGQLADEYDTEPPACNKNLEPYEANITKETSRALIKWNAGGGPPFGWIDPQTPIPTTDPTLSVPGLYEGAKYCKTGLFRAASNSKMRTLFLPFYQVNEEQLIKRIYNWISPIDSFGPETGSLVLEPGEVVTFQVTTPRPLSHGLQVTWTLDGLALGSGSTISSDIVPFDRRTHLLELIVRDTTPKVRNDPGAALEERKTWIIRLGQILAPMDLIGVRKLNRSLSRAEYINVLSWKAHPDNVDIVKYRISQRQGEGLIFLAETQADGLEYRHRLTDRGRTYEYAVAAVDKFGVVGEAATVIVK